MADRKQFGGPGIRQFGDRMPGDKLGETGHCAQCEAMLADAQDGTLTAADQAFFELHVAHCGSCAQSLADARQGIAFLEMLRHPQPEPPAELLEKILAQTSGGAQHAAVPSLVPAPGELGVAALVPGYAPGRPGNLLPFRQRMTLAVRTSAIGQIMLQPRLAMTAAMAFFSIALTLNLTGVRLQDLRASDLKPSSLKRSFYSANARVVQYYEGLRVVYELESRVHDLQNGADSETSGSPAAQPASASPEDQGKPGAQDGPDQPAGKQPEQKKKPAPSGPASRQLPPMGTSRREGLRKTLALAAMVRENSIQYNPLGQTSFAAAHSSTDGVEGSLV